MAPLVIGLIAGALVGWNAGFYWALIALVVLGGIAAGYDQHSMFMSVLNALIGAALFTSGFLLSHNFTEWAPVVPLVDPVSNLWAINLGAGSLLGVIGGTIRKIK